MMKKLSDRFMYYSGILASVCPAAAQDLKHIMDLIEAEEKGLLLKLPCKVGDEVWRIYTQHDSYDDSPYKVTTRDSFRLDMLNCIGETVFLTKEEAEAKLKELENE